MTRRRADEGTSIPGARTPPKARTAPDTRPEPETTLPADPVDDELDGDATLAPAPTPEEPRTGDETGLGEREREILDFERQWWRHAGAKEQAIRERFGLSATRYYQALNALLDEPAATEHDPVLVARLRRLRTSRIRRPSG